MASKTPEQRRGAVEKALAPVAPGPGLARRSETAAVDVCRPALDALADLRDKLNEIGQVCRDWPGGLPPVVGESLASAAEGVGTAYRGVSAADAAIKSAEFGRR